MTSKVYALIYGIATGVEAIALAICGFAIADAFIKSAVLASIPVAINAGLAICKNFVKDDTNKIEEKK